MYKFGAYLILCLFLMFLDFYFDLRGLLTLILDIIISIFLITSFNDVKKTLKINYSHYLLYGIIILILLSVFKEILVRYFYDYPINDNNQIDAFFIGSIIIKSFTEEVIFRGYWLKKLLEKHKVSTSIFIVSFGFAFLHFFARNNPIFAFISSIVLSYIFTKKQSILNTFMIHLSSNLFFIFGLPYIIAFYSNTEARIQIKTIVIVFLVIIYLFKLLFKKSDDDKK